jgi:signal transduction histidine kinase
VLNKNKSVVEINNSGRKFFNLAGDVINDKTLNELICPDAEDKIFNTESNIIETVCVRENQKKHLLISRSEFYDSENNLNYVLIIKDLTSIKELEEQIERGKQLTAMGHLASGVAHEIRNPLNAISTIVQQLSRDFEPVEDKEDYLSFTSLIYNEVKRINKTIESFLNLAKPVPIRKEIFNLDELFQDIRLQYKSELERLNIKFTVSNNYYGQVNWDKDQVKQALINLINNARDAVKNGGSITVNAEKYLNEIVIMVEDDGAGITEENINKIFNLYFTTKAEGTGIGLGITQRIINEHGGILTVDSIPGQGTKFTIKLKSG